MKLDIKVLQVTEIFTYPSKFTGKTLSDPCESRDYSTKSREVSNGAPQVWGKCEINTFEVKKIYLYCTVHFLSLTITVYTSNPDNQMHSNLFTRFFSYRVNLPYLATLGPAPSRTSEFDGVWIFIFYTRKKIQLNLHTHTRAPWNYMTGDYVPWLRGTKVEVT